VLIVEINSSRQSMLLERVIIVVALVSLINEARTHMLHKGTGTYFATGGTWQNGHNSY
jgi:hypothetical protein